MIVSSSANRSQPVGRRAGLTKAFSLHVVGQDPECIEKIRLVAEPLGMMVQTYQSGEEFLQNFDGERPACLISELHLSDMDVFRLLMELQSRDSFVPLIVLARCLDVRTAVAVIRAGALTVVENPLCEQELGESLCQAIVFEQRYRELFSHKREIVARLAELTEQEKSVLNLMVNGLPNKSIASRLDVSLRTVEGRRREVFNKLHANSLAEAVRLVTAAEMPVCVCHPQHAEAPAPHAPAEDSPSSRAAQPASIQQIDVEEQRG